MFFSEEELLLILKKNLPNTPVKDLEEVAHSILVEGKHWQEVSLHEKIHDQVEADFLHEICKRDARSEKPKEIRLFYKK